jgi:hypothetical protein
VLNFFSRQPWRICPAYVALPSRFDGRGDRDAAHGRLYGRRQLDAIRVLDMAISSSVNSMGEAAISPSIKNGPHPVEPSPE